MKLTQYFKKMNVFNHRIRETARCVQASLSNFQFINYISSLSFASILSRIVSRKTDTNSALLV